MPTEQQRLTAALTGTVAAAAVIAVMYWARAVFIPVALALLLSFILAPIMMRLHRRGVNRAAAVAITVGLAMTVTGGVAALLSRQIVELASTLPDRRDAIKEKLVQAKRAIVGDGQSQFAQLVDEITEVISPSSHDQVVMVKPVPGGIGQKLEQYVGPAAEILGQAAFTFLLTIFMLLRHEDLRNRVIRLAGDGRIMATTKAVDDASRRISRYLLSQLMLNASFGLAIAVGLLLLGVPFALLWGVIAGMSRYIPYIGVWACMLLPLAFSITTAPEWGGGWGQPGGVLALYAMLELVCNNLEPRIFGKSMGVSEVAQLVAAAVWAFLWGPVGLILSGPLTACLIVLGRHVPRFRYLVVLLGDEPPLSPSAAFYQRLAARDQDEASEVAHQVAKDTSVEACYDTVLIPALCRARRDVGSGELDPGDLEFIVDATEEVAAELVLAEHSEPVAAGTEEPVRLLLTPAREKSEKVAAQIFASTLDAGRWETEVVGDAMVAGELLERVEEFRPAAVLIAAMPPGGVSHTNYLITRLKKRFPKLKIHIGRWGVDEDGREGALRGADSTSTSFADSRKQLEDLHAILEAAEPVLA